MKRIEAPTLQEAYTKATEELGCSITDLNFEIVQNDSKGFLGFFKKSAIIVASCKNPSKKEREPLQKIKNPKRSSSAENRQNREPKKERPKTEPVIQETVYEQAEEKIETETALNSKKYRVTDDIVNSFNMDSNNFAVLEDIEYELKELFRHICYDVEIAEVSFYDEKTVKIRFDGNDAALLIGKEGYRYKALSYMLFNWINPKYNLLLRLEIAEFLQNQEEYIRKYLEPIRNNIEKYGKGQTKTLDGVLVQIALKELRAAFPDKYVAIRNNSSGEKYIVVNEFSNKQ